MTRGKHQARGPVSASGGFRQRHQVMTEPWMSSKRRLPADADGTKGRADCDFCRSSCTILQKNIFMTTRVRSVSLMTEKFSSVLSRFSSRTLALVALLVGVSHSAQAATYQYHGLIDLDYGSSIPGAPKHSRYFVDFTLNGADLDTDNTVFENDLSNANGVRGLTTMASFSNPIRSLRLTLDPTSVGTLDLSTLNFDSNSYSARAVDANQPPDPQAPPCDE